MKDFLRSEEAMPYSYQAVSSSIPKTAPVPKDLDWNTLVVEPIDKMLINVTGFIPDLIGAFYILIFGWILAKIVMIFVEKCLKSIGFDKIAKKTGITETLNIEETKIETNRWFALLSFWIVMIGAVIMALEKIRIYVASVQLNTLFSYVFTIGNALLILVLGMFLSVLVSNIVLTLARNLNIPRPETQAGIIRWAILIFAMTASLMHLGLAPQILLIIFAASYISICIAFVIAFGAGGVGWAAKVLDRTLDKRS